MTIDVPGQSAKALFDRRAGLYGTGWTAYFWEFGRLLAGQAAASPGTLALDVAVGTGAVSLPLAQAGARVLALDVSTAMLAHRTGRSGRLLSPRTPPAHCGGRGVTGSSTRSER